MNREELLAKARAKRAETIIAERKAERYNALKSLITGWSGIATIARWKEFFEALKELIDD